MKRRNRASALVALLCLCLLLSGCGGLREQLESRLWETAAPTLVQGNMALLYQGTCDEDYLSLVNSTEEDCRPYYEECMELQAQAFMTVFEVYDPDGTQLERFIDIMEEVYAQSDYSVGACTQVDDTHFLVDVSVKPLDFPQQAYDAFSQGLATFQQEYGQLTDAELNAMTDSEYAAYEAVWADGIYACCQTALAEGLRMLEPVTVQMAVSKTDAGQWAIDDDSMVAFDEALMRYPDTFE